MNFLDLFSLNDVFLAATGLMLVSILRIYYDSYVEKKKVKRFGSSLEIYNSLIEDSREGLLIISDNNEIIFANTEATNILRTNTEKLDSSYLDTLRIENEDNGKNESLFEMLHTKNYIANAYLINNSHKLPISISINKVNTSPNAYNYWSIVILRDMTSINDLREGARGLLE